MNNSSTELRIVIIALAIIAIITASPFFSIVSKKDIKMILDQCHIVRQDYKAALYKFSGASNADPQTTCFDSVSDARDLRKFLKQLKSGNLDEDTR